MADANTNQTPAPAANAPKVKTVEDMPQRTFCNSPADAAATITRFMTEYTDFGNQEIVAQGMSQNEAGELVFDPAIYTDQTRVMISKVTYRDDKVTKLKAIMITPTPTIEAILADAAGREWAAKMIEVQLNAAAARELRKEDVVVNANTIGEILAKMPKTLADFVTSSRESSGTLLECFENNWRDIKAVLGELSKQFKIANLSKKEFRRGMESANYAARTYPLIEQTKRGSVFVLGIQAFILAATEQGHDKSIFEKWLANRDSYNIDVNDDEDEGEFTLDQLAKLMAKPATEAATNQEAQAATEAAPAA